MFSRDYSHHFLDRTSAKPSTSQTHASVHPEEEGMVAVPPPAFPVVRARRQGLPDPADKFRALGVGLSDSEIREALDYLAPSESRQTSLSNT